MQDLALLKISSLEIPSLKIPSSKVCFVNGYVGKCFCGVETHFSLSVLYEDYYPIGTIFAHHQCRVCGACFFFQRQLFLKEEKKYRYFELWDVTRWVQLDSPDGKPPINEPTETYRS